MAQANDTQGLAWDRDYATAEERALAAEANARSGIPELMRNSTLIESTMARKAA